MRGKKKDHVSLVLLSVRLDKDVYEYLKEHYPYKMQAVIRKAVRDFTKIDINLDRNIDGEQDDSNTNY